MKIIKRQVITLFLSFALAVTGLQTPFISPIDTHAAEARLNQAQTASIDLNRNGRNKQVTFAPVNANPDDGDPSSKMIPKVPFNQG